MRKSLLWALLVSGPAFAWGPQGHRIVGEIASRHLSGRTKKKIAEIIGTDSLARVSTWADDIRSDSSWDHVKPWHFASVADGSDYAHSDKDPAGDVIVAIAKNEAVLRGKGASQEERKQALKFLVHLVGDIHQPLHVGRKEDLGGNAIKVKFFGQNTNLHSVWDSGMIDFEKLSFTEYANFLDHASKKEIEDLQNDSVEAWAQEAIDMRLPIYELPQAKPAPKPDKNASIAQVHDRMPAAVGDPGEPPMPSLSYDYQSKHIRTVEKQLLKAGLRLAGRLEAIFR